MNLGGGASNVDLSEAARLLKQNTGGAGVPNQQVPPPMMLMQQAVAMQQFQFQQALLMQQVMATQQAAARAATVKSAQEMAAARAAEISKQLKGNEPDAEEEKKSPGRSKSRTPSRSRSRSGSLSRSKSRSPLRYRRDRSASRSPLRYRRDSRPSPSRSRDYYSYRSRSRRGYYRGRGDYPWNSSFRRDWDRDRDHYSSRGTRRSRSRSRSRVRRRSRTRSRSPRNRRDRSVTPPRYGRDERRVGRSSRRSRSRETKPSPSHSSRSRSESLHREDASRSPPRKSREVGSGGGSRKGDSLSPVPKSGRRALCPSPALKDHKERLDVDDLSDSKGGDATERSSPAKKCISGPLTSPARSLSDSLSPPERFGEKFVEVVPDDNGQSGWKKNNLQDTSGWKTDGVSSVENLRTNQSLSGWASGAGVSVAEKPYEQESGPKSAIKGKSGEFIGRQARQARKESSGKLGYQSEEDSDGGGDEIDDWRDDIKGHEREKAKRKDIKLEAERREEEKKGMLAEVTVVKEVGGPAVILLEHIGKGSGKIAEEATIVVSEPVQDLGAVFKTGNDMTGLDYVNVEAKISKVIDENLSKQEFLKEESNRKGHTKGGEEDEEVSVIAAIPKEDVKGKSSDFTEGPDFETEVNVVFEGPKPAYDEVPAPTAGGTYKKADDLPKDLSRKHHGSSKVDEDIVEIGAQQLPTAREEEDLIRSHKGKEKLKSRERSRRHEVDVDCNRRKDRHRKHKRKHRRDEEIEKEEDDDDDHGGDGEGGKDKEERRHRSSKKHRSRDNGDRRDRKKRRHRHRGKSATISPEKDSVLAEAEGAQDVDDVPKAVYKKHSSGHEKRRKAVSKSPASGSASD